MGIPNLWDCNPSRFLPKADFGESQQQHSIPMRLRRPSPPQQADLSDQISTYAWQKANKRAGRQTGIMVMTHGDFSNAEGLETPCRPVDLHGQS